MADFSSLQQKVLSQLLPDEQPSGGEKKLLTESLMGLFNLEILNLAAEKLSSRDLYLFMGAVQVDSSVLLPMLAEKIPDFEGELLKRVRVKFEEIKRCPR
jgi:hypothetical protein